MKSVSSRGFEPTIPSIDQPQYYNLDRMGFGIGIGKMYEL
jgi:hypothetical protein